MAYCRYDKNSEAYIYRIKSDICNVQVSRFNISVSVVGIIQLISLVIFLRNAGVKIPDSVLERMYHEAGYVNTLGELRPEAFVDVTLYNESAWRVNNGK